MVFTVVLTFSLADSFCVYQTNKLFGSLGELVRNYCHAV